MRFIVITTLAALAGFFACRTTIDETQSTVKDDVGQVTPSSQTISKPAAEALLTVLYGN